MDIKNLIYAAIWLVVFFASIADYGAVTAAIGATLITGVAWVVWERRQRGERRRRRRRGARSRM